jgi:2'-5' RNA ligase
MKYLKLFEQLVDDDFKSWDELFGILAWKFKPTENGDLFLDGEKTYNELRKKFTLKKFEEFLIESVSSELKDFLKKEYDDLKDEYGFYEIKVDEPEKIKKKLLKDFESGIMKIDVDNKKLKIFKNNAKFDCVMLYADMDKKMWKKIQNEINDDDLYEDPEGIEKYGREMTPHLTLFYGIHSSENDKEKIIKKLEKYKPIELEIGEIGIFEGDKFDVIKIAVKPTKELLNYRKDLLDNTKNTQTYNEYHPHLTICYVKKGKGKEYIKKIKIDEMKLVFDTIKYSDYKYNKKTIKLK